MPVKVYRLVGLLIVSGLFITGLLTTSNGDTQTSEARGAEATKSPTQTAKATFAGGCFWCMEPPFDALDGVNATISGYAGGKEKNPTYKEVSAGATGHAEALRVEYDPAVITYEELLAVFWRNIDPTITDRQFCDRGTQYRTAIFYHDEEQESLARASKAALIGSGRLDRVVTEIMALNKFYEAEEYHQDFYKKNPDHYKEYRFNCGRDQRLRELWGDSKPESK